MISKTVLIALLIAYAEARFGQEQLPIDAISQVQGGDAGAAATIAGGAISTLLGGADACDKLVTADQIVADLGGGADAIAAAIGLVAAEKNTNPFANGNAQVVCDDPTLPATAELRGITPLIDPDVDGAADVNDLSAQTQATPLNADGLSILDLIEAQIAGVVVGQNGGAAAGGADDAADAGAEDEADAGAEDEADAGAEDEADAGAEDEADAGAEDEVDAGEDDQADADAELAAACELIANAGAADNNDEQQADDEADAGADDQADDQQANDEADAGADEEADAGADGEEAAAGGDVGAGGEDFGLCIPTIVFEAGVNGRAADEFTFQIADELARGGQGEALNPDIITNALCNQLTNVCEANDAAVALCESAAAQVAGGDRNKALADEFNAAVGFAGAVTNPSGGPEDVAALKLRRALKFRA